jgi:hypothetical protein
MVLPAFPCIVLQPDSDSSHGSTTEMEGTIREDIQILAVPLQQKTAATKPSVSMAEDNGELPCLLLNPALTGAEWPGRLEDREEVKNRLKRSIRNRRKHIGRSVQSHRGRLLTIEVGELDLIDRWWNLLRQGDVR